MRVDSPATNDGKDPAKNSYDDIYLQSWQAALSACEETLEGHDHKRALQVKSLDDFRNELQSLMQQYPDQNSVNAINLFRPVLDHYDTFARNFVRMMASAVDVSMMWGLLFLVLKLALEDDDGEASPLKRITRWLEKIGHKLRASNDCSEDFTDFTKVKGDNIEVNRECVLLWLNIIMTFRNNRQDRFAVLDESAWEDLTKLYNDAYRNIDEAVRRIEKVAEMTLRHAQSMIDMAQFQRLLSLPNNNAHNIRLPCNTLPVAMNRRFYGRQDLLQQIDEFLKPADVKSPLASIALHGLGGMGKTQIALAYAYQRLDDLDAVFWISSEDALSIQQSFSHVAVDALKIPEAHAGSHQENMILVLDWLQKTSSKWLVVFDNVDSHDVLDNCWPASKHGAILVTTRDVLIATLPIDLGVEVLEFNEQQGAEFLVQMAHNRKRVAGELETAQEVSRILGGLPLALNQMAAFINARGCSFQEFVRMYAKHYQRLHKEKKSGHRYLGYDHTLETVWKISFDALGEDAQVLLGVLSFYSADSIPSDIFRVADPDTLPKVLAFCEDDYSFGDAIEQLTHHALVRKNIEEGTLRLHRLVQSEYRDRMEDPQEEFEAAINLLLEKFPPRRGNTYDNDEWLLYERYIPHVMALVRNYNASLSKPNPLKPNMDLVHLLTTAANAIHDNDTANVVGDFLNTADAAYWLCPEPKRDRLLFAFLLSLKCMHHLSTSDFVKSEKEMREGLEIRLELLPHTDLLICLAYQWLGMAVGSQGRYEEGLELLLKAGKVLEGPAGDAPTRKLLWGYNTSRAYYVMGNYDKADELLTAAVAEADSRPSWYLQLYGHVTMTSLRTRMGRLDDARTHIDRAKKILETSGSLARYSWTSSYCAYRAGQVALLQANIEEAIEEAEKAVAIGKLTKVPVGILSRCTHAYSKALARDPSRAQDAERQRIEARRLRMQVPGGGGDLDDESDEAFEMQVKMDHR